MGDRRLFSLALGLCLCVVGAGCEDLFSNSTGETSLAPQEVPPSLEGTVGEQAVLVGGGWVSAQGYGLVVGLGTNGSAEIPPPVRKYLVEMLLKEEIHSWRQGTESLTTDMMLDSKDTAVVLIGGSIPPGAPVGTRFDLFVSALRQTGTRSLEGGVLLPTDLRLSLRGIATAGRGTSVWASAAGSILVNPFIDPTDPGQEPKLREGRIVNGGVVTAPRPLRLNLRRPDFAMASLLERRINERFPADTPVANARSRAVIELTVPPAYREEYERFLDLLLHLPLRASGGGEDSRAVRIAEAMLNDKDDHESLALVWEAMGRQVLPVVSRLYTVENPNASYYAARTGLRLGDVNALEVLVDVANDPNSPLRVPAVQELGRHPRLIKGVIALRRLLDDSNEIVRLSAYESLAKIGDAASVRSIPVGEEFTLDVVKTEGPAVVYATRTGRPKIVVFGTGLQVHNPVFFNSPDDLVTVTNGARYYFVRGDDLGKGKLLAVDIARTELHDATLAEEVLAANPGVDWNDVVEGTRIIVPPAERMMVFRKIPYSGRQTPPLYVDFGVRTLIETLGSPAVRDINGKVAGLNLTYGQVVSVVYRMCKNGDIPARFVLQTLPEIQNMYMSSTAAEGT